MDGPVPISSERNRGMYSSGLKSSIPGGGGGMPMMLKVTSGDMDSPSWLDPPASPAPRRLLLI